MSVHQPKGKKNRKFGRAGRSPSHKRYNSEKRWERNKTRRVEKERKRQERLKERAKRCHVSTNVIN